MPTLDRSPKSSPPRPESAGSAPGARRALALALGLATLAPPVARAATPPPRSLVVCAHPDDELLFAGTLALAARAGWDLEVVYATSGDAGEDRTGRGLSGARLAAVREGEARRALPRLGVQAEPRFLRFPDGRVFEQFFAVHDRLVELLDEVRPEVVLTLGTNGVTGHRDHVAIGVAVLTALRTRGRPARLLRALFTEARAARFPPAWPMRAVAEAGVDLTVDVRTTGRERSLLLGAYPTQFRPDAVQFFRRRVLPGDPVETFEQILVAGARGGALPGIPTRGQP